MTPRHKHPIEFLEAAVEQILAGNLDGCEHIYYREMSGADAQRLDRWLAGTEPPEDGTPWNRFVSIVNRWVAQERLIRGGPRTPESSP